MRALTGLKQAGLALQKDDVTGPPPEMPIHRVHFDPSNARRDEDENSPEGLEEQSELTQDIKKRGVKSPVSLRPHPTVTGEYMLNYGHRRLRGAIEAGLATIPYFIDVSFDSYDQVKENLLHRKPSIWALAEFIQRRLDEGQSKGEIAEGLGKANQNLVTELHALVDAPRCLHHAYANGVRSTRTLYDLRRAYDDYPEQTEAWCASGEKITRETIRLLVVRSQTAAADKSSTDGSIDETQRAETKRGDMGTAKVNSTGPAATPARADSGSNTPVVNQNAEVPARGGWQQRVNNSPELRHDVKTQDQPDEQSVPLENAKSIPNSHWIMVEYLGKTAKIAPDTRVQILLDQDSELLNVSIAELTFTKPA